MPPRTEPRGHPAPTPTLTLPPCWAVGQPGTSGAPPLSTPFVIRGGGKRSGRPRQERCSAGDVPVPCRLLPARRCSPPAPLRSAPLAARGSWCWPAVPTGSPSPAGSYILLSHGGELHVGSERCRYGWGHHPAGRASRRGSAAQGFGQKFVVVGRGDVLELADVLPGRRRRFGPCWTGRCLPAGPARPDCPRGAGAAAGSTCRPGRWHGAAAGGGALRHSPAAGRRPAAQRIPGSAAPGSLVATAVRDSAARSLSPEPRLCCGTARAATPPSAGATGSPGRWWGSSEGDQLSTAEDKREYHGNGTAGLAIAQRDLLTYDSTCFTVAAFSGWIKGVLYSGFKVEVSKGIILHLVDEVTSWLPGDHIVIASSDYFMHQAEEFNLLPCPECRSNQLKIDGLKYFYQGSPLYLHTGEVIDGVDLRTRLVF